MDEAREAVRVVDRYSEITDAGTDRLALATIRIASFEKRAIANTKLRSHGSHSFKRLNAEDRACYGRNRSEGL
jgi:hypothetical protein